LNQMLSKVYDSKNGNLILPIEQGNENEILFVKWTKTIKKWIVK
jgi:hypothetical protein